jgi:thiamine biosynthesis lipoprotein
MSHARFAAMGTTVEAWDGDGRLRPWFETVEGICSRFRSDSELSAINEAAPGTVQVSALMLEVLRAAARAQELTAGFVDIAVEPAVAAWGYDRTFEDVGDLSTEPAPIAVGRWRVHGSSLTLAPGTRVDLGGIAKGWTCDRAVEAGMATVVSAGGDLRSADQRTVVDVADPWGTTVARVVVGVGALATSSVTRRRWKAGNHPATHIIDPRTMSPVVSPVLSASVVADSAVDAEAGAKAVLIHGSDGLAWAEEQGWLRSALVVWDDGAVYATHGTELAA